MNQNVIRPNISQTQITSKRPAAFTFSLTEGNELGNTA